MAFDLRNYKGEIRRAVLRERHCDEHWSWKVLAIRENVAKIRWDYLRHIGEDRDFDLSVVSDDVIGTAVVCRVPCGHKTVRFVGSKSYDDCKTIEEGIASAIHGAALYAHATY